MRDVLDRAAKELDRVRRLPPEKGIAVIQEALALLEAVPPGRERDGMMALAYLRLAQLKQRLGKSEEAERAFWVGFSYARTSGEVRVRRFAERLKEEFDA
ncbi:hypothetical protein [Marinithermus hydrothermalis]|uniref:Tetratricopeptide repeat protein n=1 Tax=Marinithermus hydrothermalis (strain DSM 14884 / JCM 11576 / T1) TaxID=869210 RepID=F2NM79_MARHT|nr:hypothetical protein [Marinithermus hydrothermalis]AEB11549.1 hypothetical protein Marky_0801 [Marinithermus hydrothermalis DSM 14884]